MISETYRAQLAQLHKEKEDFGTSSPMYAGMIRTIIRQYECGDLLDYGAGKQALKKALGIKEGYFAYDPSIEEISAVPEARDLVVCTDVLEHVELGYVPKVIADLARCVRKVGFFAIHTGAALNVLPDGRNAHICQFPARWWLHHLIKHFDIVQLNAEELGFWVIVKPIKE